MNVEHLIQELARRGVKLSLAEGGGLRVRSQSGALDAELRDRLSACKADVVEWIQRQQAVLSSRPRIPVAPSAETYPLSFAQKRLWFLDQVGGGQDASTYCIPSATRLKGPLDRERLIAALHKVVDRHDILRTYYVTIDGEPKQKIAKSGTPDIRIVDLGEHFLEDRAGAKGVLDEHLKRETERGFDLSTSGPVRVRLYIHDSREHTLFISFHHIASDGWSNQVFLRDLSSFYEADGSPDPLPIQYRDYAAWQRQQWNEDRLSSELEYWQKTLEGFQPASLRGNDVPVPAHGHGRTLNHELAASSIRLLERLAAEHKTTLFTVLLSAFYVLLSRHTRQTDLTIGTDVAGRQVTELEDLVGFFVNQLVLRCTVQPTDTFDSLIERVKAVTTQAYSHQDMPFDVLVERFPGSRLQGDAAFFTVKFIMQAETQGDGEADSGDLAFHPVALPFEHARFDMTWSLVRGADHAVRISVEYRSGQFDAPTITSLLEQYDRLLQQLGAHPDAAVRNAPLAQAGFVEWLRESNRDNRQNVADTVTLASALASRAQAQPDSIAIVDGSTRLTYAQLQDQVEKFAVYLTQMGVYPGARVGICLDSGIDYVRAVCAVSRVGAAFIPIPTSMPADRAGQIIADSAMDLLVSRSDVVDELPAFELSFMSVICVDDEAEDWQSLDGDSVPAVSAHPQQLAYMIYTSGTTGTPKGVMVGVQGFGALIEDQKHRFGVTPDSTILQFASIGFDASVWEIAMALGNGAGLVCGHREQLMPGVDLQRFVVDHGISHATLPPSALSVMDPSAMPCLEVLIVAGEACKDGVIAPWQRKLRVYNAYGPSETTVCATVRATCAGSEPGFQGNIGTSILGTDVYVLDRDGHPAPVGMEGELVISGRSVGQGYHGDPRRTALAFVPDHLSGRRGSRVYKTGDAVRLMQDGSIRFEGRLDQQIKIRGFRVEVGEIEKHLLNHPLVSDAAIVVDEQERLQAYVVAPDQLDREQLRTSLRSSLPDYMVPATLTCIGRIPLTSNGKLDLQALPKPEVMSASAATAPENEVERQIAAIWCEVLGLDTVGRTTNFFDAGGHSLLLVKVQEQIQHQLGRELSVAELFRHPTVQQLAHALGEAQESKTDLADVDDRVARRKAGRGRKRAVAEV